MSSDTKKIRKATSAGTPKRAIESVPEPAIEPTLASAAEALPSVESDLKRARSSDGLQDTDKKAMLARIKARYQTGATTSAAPVNVVDSASADALGFPAFVGRVHSAKISPNDPTKCNVDLIVSKIIAPTSSAIVASNYLHAIYTQKPAIDPSAPPKPKAVGQISEKHDRIINNKPLFYEVTSHAHVTYPIKSDGSNPPPPVGACVRFLNVEPKRGMKPGTETEVYLNCTGGFVEVGPPCRPHVAMSEYLHALQYDTRITAAHTRDILKASGGATQFVIPSGANNDSSMSAGERSLVAYEHKRKSERADIAARIAALADRIPSKDVDRNGKGEALRALSKKLAEDDLCLVPQSATANTTSSYVIVNRGGRGGGQFEGSALVNVEEDPRIVNIFDEEGAANVPNTFCTTRLAYPPSTRGKLITMHFLMEVVLDKTIPPEGEMNDDSSGIIKSVVNIEPPGKIARTPVCGFKMTTAVAGISLGVLSKVHLLPLLDKYVQHLPFAALVKTGDREPYQADEPIDVDWVKGWNVDMPSFLTQMGVWVGEEWALANVANGRTNFPPLRLTVEGAQPTALPVPQGYARPHLQTSGFVNLLEADGAAPDDLKSFQYPGVAVRYYMLPLGTNAPTTLSIDTSQADGEAYMSKLIAGSGKDPRTFFETGLCLPSAVFVTAGWVD